MHSQQIYFLNTIKLFLTLKNFVLLFFTFLFLFLLIIRLLLFLFYPENYFPKINITF